MEEEDSEEVTRESNEAGRRSYLETNDLLANEEQAVIKLAMDNTDADISLEAERASLLFVTLFEVQRSDIKHLKLPADTLYSASVAMPMIARSSGYPLTLTSNAVKMVTLNIFCMILQATLLLSLVVARRQLPQLDGVPSLCTYGQDVGAQTTPRGPNGIIFDKVYGNVETDYTMLVVRNNLKRVMEQLGLEAQPPVGPVEYGTESATCRMACVAVFTIAVCHELFLSYSMVTFLFCTPHLSWGKPQDPWVMFHEQVEGNLNPTNQRGNTWQSIGKSNLDYVVFVANGVPYSWKLFSGLLILLHFVIIFNVFWSGVVLLLNTGGIIDLILDSVAATFIMELDRLMFLAFTTKLCRDVMNRLEPYIAAIHSGALQDGYKEHQDSELGYSSFTFAKKLLAATWPMFFMLGVTFLGHYIYFKNNCELVSYPFNFRDWFAKAYFSGQTRVFGGWEFVFGSWRSQPVEWDNKVLCKPASVTPDGQLLEAVEGCGWPENWARGQ